MNRRTTQPDIWYDIGGAKVLAVEVGATMTGRSQFNLKAILVIIAVVSLPLAMVGSGFAAVVFGALAVLLSAAGAIVGYLGGGQKAATRGFYAGLAIAVLSFGFVKWLCGMVE